MSTNRLIVLIFIGLITFAIVFAVKKPELVQDFWLWLLGLAAPIIRIAKLLWNVLVQKGAQVLAWVNKEEEHIKERLKTSTSNVTKEIKQGLEI